MNDTMLREAAAARGVAMRAAADRPRERRCEERAGTLPVMRARVQVELRDSATVAGALHYTGYASVTDTPYEMWDMFGPYNETVRGGAFGKTLARADLDVPLVLQHESLRRIARTTNGTLTLAEDSVGLAVDAPALDPSDSDVAYIAPKLRSGLIDEMSFKFLIVRGQWSPDWMEYYIDEVDIHRGDVAIVGYGANPHTAGTLRGAVDIAHLPTPDLRQMQARAGAELRRRGEKPPMTLSELVAIGD